ncbi:hypothetical protein C2E21_5177 [Chlorella sorokiniana]|uniref:Uncharacterized protein n=1 Tax=Chlorella sorokiniana TaxID=3076 RepID=A0A2P6TQN9_CHLSO|nr:hypothetical protein C2E21_5177 [Chlorella sorokiniana]|eukprot:PRW56355.1 hypothetical protein C2E21_5177 [Chlorella sorokiniana]
MPLRGELVPFNSPPREQQLEWLALSANDVMGQAAAAPKIPADLRILCETLLKLSCPIDSPYPGAPIGLVVQTLPALQQIDSLNAAIEQFRAASAADGPPQTQPERLQRLVYLLEFLNGNKSLLGHSTLLPWSNTRVEMVEVAARLPFACKSVAVYLTDRDLEASTGCRQS